MKMGLVLMKLHIKMLEMGQDFSVEFLFVSVYRRFINLAGARS